MIMQDDLKRAAEVLQSGGTIIYPSDTIWGIGCDATNQRAIDKIYKMKFNTPQETLIILVDGVEMIHKYVKDAPELALDMMLSVTDPITVFFNNARNLAKNIIPEDGSVGIRIPKDEFCLQLIGMLGKPITSTSANKSGDPTPLSFGKIDPKIKAAVDYICKSNQSNINTMKASTIIRINKDGQLEIVKK
jgi:L-threonylcarbamoyladenylate synthase